MRYKFKRIKAMKRRVHSEWSYRESPVAAKEKMRKGWKMVLEPRTERRIPLGCDGGARDSARVSVNDDLPVLVEAAIVKLQ